MKTHKDYIDSGFVISQPTEKVEMVTIDFSFTNTYYGEPEEDKIRILNVVKGQEKEAIKSYLEIDGDFKGTFIILNTFPQNKFVDGFVAENVSFLYNNSTNSYMKEKDNNSQMELGK